MRGRRFKFMRELKHRAHLVDSAARVCGPRAASVNFKDCSTRQVIDFD
jgi:hypothetical protein